MPISHEEVPPKVSAKLRFGSLGDVDLPSIQPLLHSDVPGAQNAYSQAAGIVNALPYIIPGIGHVLMANDIADSVERGDILSAGALSALAAPTKVLRAIQRRPVGSSMVAGAATMAPSEAEAAPPMSLREALRTGRLLPTRDVYHGTINKFSEFDPARAGTGEGGAGYGAAAAYTAESPAVARGYAEMLRDRVKNIITHHGAPLPEEQALAMLRELEAGDAAHLIDRSDIGSAIDRQRSFLQSFNADKAERNIRDLERLRDAGVDSQKTPAYLYRVEVPDTPNYLMWQEPSGPLSALAGLDPSAPGTQVYHRLSRELGGLQQASRALYDNGLVGVRYRDRFSVGAPKGEGTMNRTIFNPDDAIIREIQELK